MLTSTFIPRSTSEMIFGRPFTIVITVEGQRGRRTTDTAANVASPGFLVGTLIDAHTILRNRTYGKLVTPVCNKKKPKNQFQTIKK